MKDKKIIAILFATIFINLLGFAIILPLSPAMLAYYLPNTAQEGGLLGLFVKYTESLATSVGNGSLHSSASVFFGCSLASLYAFLQFVMNPIWGRLSDRFGRQSILRITLWGTALSYLLWVFAHHFEVFILSRALAGLMAGNLAVATAAIADITSRKERTYGMALVGVAFSLGFIFGPAFGGLLSQIDLTALYPKLAAFGLHPFSAAALAAALLALGNCLFLECAFTETLPKAKRMEPKETVRRLNALVKAPKGVLNINFSYFIFILSFSGLEFTLAFLAAERFGYSPKALGFLFLYIGCMLILAQGVIVRRLSKGLQEKTIALLGIICGLISYNTLAFCHTTEMLLLGCAFLAFAVGLVSPSLSSAVSLLTSEKEQGRFLGIFRSAGSLARACGPLVAAIPYFYWGSTFAYVSVSLMLFIPLATLPLLPKIDKSE